MLGRPLMARAVTARETDPMRDELPTQRISRVSNRLRDEHMLDRLLAALAAHGRVFATVGVSHAVMLEPALRAGARRIAEIHPRDAEARKRRTCLPASASRHRGGEASQSQRVRRIDLMDALTLFGLFAVTLMLVCYALEARSPWFILAFAVSCALGSAYGFLQGAWPFGVVEAIWSLVALRRWRAVATARLEGL